MFLALTYDYTLVPNKPLTQINPFTDECKQPAADF